MLATALRIYFVVILDAAIVRLAIPSIDSDLGLSAAAETWVANAYMLTFGTLLLLGGRLADVVGRKRMLLAGVALFTLASLACGLAPSGAALIAARAVQGIGAAAMTPAALSILMRTFAEGAERNKAIGMWAASGGIGATAAWIVGGPLVDGAGWQWVFWINVPIGAVIAALASRLLAESRDAQAPRTFDIAGTSAMTAALAVLIYALVEAPGHGWGSTRTVSLFALSLALFAVFVAIERRAADPLIPRRIARSRELLAANVGLGAAMASIYGMAFILSLYGQQVLGGPRSHSVSRACVLPIGAAVGAGLGQSARHQARPAIRVDRRDGRARPRLRPARQDLPVDGGYVSHLLPALVIFGPALGAAATSYSIATLSGVHPNDAGLASGLNNTFECICGALGTAIMASVAVTHTTGALSAGTAPLPALNDGFQLAFAIAIAFPAAGLLASIALRPARRAARTTLLAPATALETEQER